MVDTNALSALKDIVLPKPPTAWPLAPSWWIALGFFSIVLGAGAFFLYRHRRFWKWRREALRLLTLYEETYAETGDAARACGLVSALLKRVALHRLEKVDVAALHGEAWAACLGLDKEPVKSLLIERPYMPYIGNSHEDLTPLFMAARHWIGTCSP